MISQELELTLYAMFVATRARRHKDVEVEHLLLALLDNKSVAEALRFCSANIEELRKSLSDFIEATFVKVEGGDKVDSQPTESLKRVLQRAIMHVEGGKVFPVTEQTVIGPHVLVAIFGEKDSHAVWFLHQQEVARIDIINFIVHGVKKSSEYGGALGPEEKMYYYSATAGTIHALFELANRQKLTGVELEKFFKSSVREDPFPKEIPPI